MVEYQRVNNTELFTWLILELIFHTWTLFYVSWQNTDVVLILILLPDCLQGMDLSSA